MLTREQIAEKCKTLIPNPEHGPDQYRVVIDYLISSGEVPDLLKLSQMDAVETVLAFMNEA